MGVLDLGISAGSTRANLGTSGLWIPGLLPVAFGCGLLQSTEPLLSGSLGAMTDMISILRQP